MKLNQLRIFEAVSRHLNITNAAHELNMSQPAVSSQLKLLEQEYRAKFYIRKHPGMEITPQGREFLDALRAVLAQVDALEQRFKIGRDGGSLAVLVLGGSHTLSVTVLPEILIDFRRLHPEIKFVIETSHSHIMELKVQNSEVEIALITAPSYLPSCEYEPYIEYKAVAFVPTASPISRRAMTLDELIKLPLVVRRGSPSVRELKKRGYRLNLAVQCDAPEAAKIAVLGGLGVGILFRSRVDAEVCRGDLRLLNIPEMEDITSKSFVVYAKHRPLSYAATEFMKTLHKIRAHSVNDRPLLSTVDNSR